MSDNQDILNISELYGYNDADLPDSSYPISYHNISKAQKTDAKLEQKIVSHKYYTLDTFRGGDQIHNLIFRNSKICLPAEIQKNFRLVSQNALSAGVDLHRAYPPSTFLLERPSHNSPRRV